MAWVSYPNLMPTYSVMKSLFQLQVEKPMHLDMAIINRSRPSCECVKLQLDLVVDMIKYVELKIVGGNEESRIKKIKMQYNFLQKYCKNYKPKGKNKKRIHGTAFVVEKGKSRRSFKRG